MKRTVFGIAFVLVAACTESRVKKYQNLLDPMLGSSTKLDVDKKIGNPVKCDRSEMGQKCEYRTASGRNEQVPVVHKQKQAMGPDLSPFEHFDVLHLEYDNFGVLKDWQPVVLKP